MTHLIVGLLLGALYNGAGAEASRMISNTGCLFFSCYSYISPMQCQLYTHVSIYINKNFDSRLTDTKKYIDD